MRSSFDLPPLPGGDDFFISHPDVLLAMLGEDAGFEVPRGASPYHDVIRDDEEVSEFAATDQTAETFADAEDVGDARESDATTDDSADLALRSPPDAADLFGQHLWVADRVARVVHRGIDDRVSMGLLTSAARWGLWDAARRYDPARGVRFRLYANRRILGAIFDELRAEKVMPPSGTARSPELRAVLGACSFPSRELADAADIAWLTSWRSELGTRTVAVAGDVSLSGVIAADEQPADEQLAYADLLAALRAAIEALEPRDQRIVYGIYEHEMTIEAVFETFELSKSRGSRIHGEIILRLKRAMLRAGHRDLFKPGALPPLIP